MSLVADQRSNFLILREIAPTYGALSRQFNSTMLTAIESYSIESAYNFWNRKRDLNQATDQSVLILPSLPQTMLNQLIDDKRDHWNIESEYYAPYKVQVTNRNY